MTLYFFLSHSFKHFLVSFLLVLPNNTIRLENHFELFLNNKFGPCDGVALAMQTPGWMEALTLSSIHPSEFSWKQSAPLLMKVYSQKCHFCRFPLKPTLYMTSCVLLHICHFLAQDLWLITHYWLFEATVAPGRITSEPPTGQFLNLSNWKGQAVMFNFETSVENWWGQTWTNKFICCYCCC